MNRGIFVRNDLQYRDECNGFISIESEFGNQISNYQGKFILDLINAKKSVKDIVELFKTEYAIDEKSAMNDVGEFLAGLKTIKLIDYDESFFESCFFGENINVAGEKNYGLLSNAIINNYKVNDNVWFDNAASSIYYDAYLLRSRCFGHQEVYYYTCDELNIKTIMGLSNMADQNSPVYIQLIKSIENEEKIFELYNYIENELIRFGKFKIKIMIPENKFHKIFNLLDKMKFSLEGKLIKEDKINDYFIYSKILV